VRFCSECGVELEGRRRVVCSERCREARFKRLHPESYEEREWRKVERRRERRREARVPARLPRRDDCRVRVVIGGLSMPCVLVADDSTEFAEMLRATLEEAGFEVVTAYSGPAALAAMGNHEVDAAVLDVLMPGISGDAVADRLRRLYPELPIVLMTGDAGVPFVATADAPVLRKPFRHEELVDTIRGLLYP
jgi:CheY-like chemotaxis protein